MVAIIDYDAGNIASVSKACEKLGSKVVLTRDREVILSADRVILPGVGSFGDAMEKLERFGLVDVINDYVKTGKPFLGICLGLQLIFESSDETPGVKGLGLLRGSVKRIPDAEGLKIPHIGWNDITIREGSRLFAGIPQNSYVYFVHSYYLDASDKSQVAATTHYSVTIDASVEAGNVFATQFHPEKSGDVGLKILGNFLNLK